ncbi:hypothetical protein E8E11_008209 [Didymella keratinophila]|nr:hypothetical protein E8E11_008209 [Didymella keratinophila]
MKLEQRQHQVREFEKELGDAKPRPRRGIASRMVNPRKAAAKPAPTLTCSIISQSLLLHSRNVRHIALNMPVNLAFQRSPAFFHDITIINDTRPWYKLMRPFLHTSDLHLTLTWDAKEPHHLVPYFNLPEEWLGRFITYTRGELVNVRIGDDQTIYRVHKALLVEHSEYFKNAFNGSWKEAKDGIAPLEDVDQRSKSSSTGCTHKISRRSLRIGYQLQTVQLMIFGKNRPKTRARMAFWLKQSMQVVKAYIFGDRFMSERFKKAVLRSMIGSMSSPRTTEWNTRKQMSSLVSI